jgi:hypothetical protein
MVVSNPGQNVSLDTALKFNVFAKGKNAVHITSVNLDSQLSGYVTTGALVEIYNGSNLAGTGTLGLGQAISITANGTVDANTTANFLVKITGAVVSGTSQGWTTGLNDVVFDGFHANAYDNVYNDGLTKITNTK